MYRTTEEARESNQESPTAGSGEVTAKALRRSRISAKIDGPTVIQVFRTTGELASAVGGHHTRRRKWVSSGVGARHAENQIASRYGGAGLSEDIAYQNLKTVSFY